MDFLKWLNKKDKFKVDVAIAQDEELANDKILQMDKIANLYNGKSTRNIHNISYEFKNYSDAYIFVRKVKVLGLTDFAEIDGKES